MSNQINWTEQLDDEDNSYWEGPSPFTSDSDPESAPDIYWRLRQRLSGNRIEWYADHDAELGGKTGDFWLSLDKAKEACQAAHVEIIDQFAIDGSGKQGE